MATVRVSWISHDGQWWLSERVANGYHARRERLALRDETNCFASCVTLLLVVDTPSSPSLRPSQSAKRQHLLGRSKVKANGTWAKALRTEARNVEASTDGEDRHEVRLGSDHAPVGPAERATDRPQARCSTRIGPPVGERAERVLKDRSRSGEAPCGEGKLRRREVA